MLQLLLLRLRPGEPALIVEEVNAGRCMVEPTAAKYGVARQAGLSSEVAPLAVNRLEGA